MENSVKPEWPRYARTQARGATMLPSSRHRLIRLSIALAVLVGLWFMLRRLDVHALWAVLTHTSPFLLVLAAVLALVELGCRSAAWKSILLPVAPLSYGRAFRYTLAGAAASALAPGRAGEALRVWLLKRDKGIPMPTSAAVAVVERILDGVAMLIVLAPTPWMVPGLPTWVGHVLVTLLVLSVILLVAAGTLSFRSHPPRWLTSFHAGLGIARRPALLGMTMLMMVGAWLFDVACVVAVMRAVGLSLAPATGLLVLLVVNAAIVVPVMPASLGAFELGALAALAPLGVPAEQGLAFASLYHLAQVLPVVFLALLDNRFVAGPAQPQTP